MDNFTVTEVPILDRNGKRIGTDKIKRYINPPAEVPINADCMRVVCNCGTVHENVPEIEFKSWPTYTLEKCGCS
jgi:hypothetical protein